jgi:hypothetical protein
MNLEKQITLGKQKQFVLDCRPCRMEGNGKLRATVNGTLFQPDADIKVLFSGQFDSIFRFQAHLRNQTDMSEFLNIYHLPLGPIKIPNILDLGPSFLVKLQADVRSSSQDALLNSGFQILVPPFDVELLHLGDKDYSQMGVEEFKPKIIQQPSQLKAFDLSHTFNFDSEFVANFSLTPKLQMGVTLFGQTVAEGVSL